MTSDRPVYCSFGDLQHQATYSVEKAHRFTVTCQEHLPKARRHVGTGHQVIPLTGHTPPPEQPALF